MAGHDEQELESKMEIIASAGLHATHLTSTADDLSSPSPTANSIPSFHERTDQRGDGSVVDRFSDSSVLISLPKVMETHSLPSESSQSTLSTFTTVYNVVPRQESSQPQTVKVTKTVVIIPGNKKTNTPSATSTSKSTESSSSSFTSLTNTTSEITTSSFISTSSTGLITSTSDEVTPLAITPTDTMPPATELPASHQASLSPGAKAGISVAVIVIVILLLASALAGYTFYRRRNIRAYLAEKELKELGKGGKGPSMAVALDEKILDDRKDIPSSVLGKPGVSSSTIDTLVDGKVPSVVGKEVDKENPFLGLEETHGREELGKKKREWPPKRIPTIVIDPPAPSRTASKISKLSGKLSLRSKKSLKERKVKTSPSLEEAVQPTESTSEVNERTADTKPEARSHARESLFLPPIEVAQLDESIPPSLQSPFDTPTSSQFPDPLMPFEECTTIVAEMPSEKLDQVTVEEEPKEQQSSKRPDSRPLSFTPYFLLDPFQPFSTNPPILPPDSPSPTLHQDPQPELQPPTTRFSEPESPRPNSMAGFQTAVPLAFSNGFKSETLGGSEKRVLEEWFMPVAEKDPVAGGNENGNVSSGEGIGVRTDMDLNEWFASTAGASAINPGFENTRQETQMEEGRRAGKHESKIPEVETQVNIESLETNESEIEVAEESPNGGISMPNTTARRAEPVTQEEPASEILRK